MDNIHSTNLDLYGMEMRPNKPTAEARKGEGVNWTLLHSNNNSWNVAGKSRCILLGIVVLSTCTCYTFCQYIIEIEQF